MSEERAVPVAAGFLGQAVKVLIPAEKLLLYLVASGRANRLEELVEEYNRMAPALGLPALTVKMVQNRLAALELYGFIRVRRDRARGVIRRVRIHHRIDSQALVKLLARSLGLAEDS